MYTEVNYVQSLLVHKIYRTYTKCEERVLRIRVNVIRPKGSYPAQLHNLGKPIEQVHLSVTTKNLLVKGPNLEVKISLTCSQTHEVLRKYFCSIRELRLPTNYPH